jgi:hypothetical protein
MEEIDTIETIINDIEYVLKNSIDITKLNKEEKDFLFNKLNELLIRINIINWSFIDKLDNYMNINNKSSSNMGICSYKILIDIYGWELGGEHEPFVIELVGKVMPESYILSCNYLFSQKEFINSFIKSINLIVDLRNEIKNNINLIVPNCS